MSPMRNAALLLVPFALGCSAVSEPDASTASDVVLAHATPYREIERTFNHLDESGLEGCRTTFRFLNGNWVDCVVDLDPSDEASSLRQISHETLPIRSFSFPT